MEGVQGRENKLTLQCKVHSSETHLLGLRSLTKKNSPHLIHKLTNDIWNF